MFIQIKVDCNFLLLLFYLIDLPCLNKNKMKFKSNFPPWGPLWMSKSPPTRALQSLIPVDCLAPPSWGKPLIGA